MPRVDPHQPTEVHTNPQQGEPMSFVQGGGVPHTSQVTVTTTATLIFADRSAATGLNARSAAIAQQAGSTDVTIGGSDVVAGVGLVLRGNPDSTTQPAEYRNQSTDRA